MAEVTGKAEIDIGNMMTEWTIEVVIKDIKQWQWRIWIASQLVELAGWIAKIDVELVKDEP